MELGAAALTGLSPGLSRSLASCTNVVVTNVGLSTTYTSSSNDSTVISPVAGENGTTLLTLEGTYVDSGRELFGRPVFREDAEENVLYWTRGVEAIVGGAATGNAPHGWKSRNHLPPPPDKILGDNGNGALAECDSGAWIIRAEDGSYPVFLVFDCADHPADVTNEVWHMIDCRNCDAETVDGSFTMECSPESTDDDEIEYGDDETPSPTPPPFTNSPLVQIRDGFATVPPGATFEIEGGGASTCITVTVSNAIIDGEYEANIYTLSDGRYTYYHSSGAYLEWLGSSSYYRRRLSSQGTPEEQKSGGQIRGTTLVGGKPRARKLAYCYEGTWILYGPLEDDPIIYSYDCAIHPADITSTWYESVESYYTYYYYYFYYSAYPRENQVSITCSETSSSSSPGVRLAIGDNNAGTADGEASGGESSDVWNGLVISGAVIAGLALCACCLATVCFWRTMKRPRSQENAVRRQGMAPPNASSGVIAISRSGRPAGGSRRPEVSSGGGSTSEIVSAPVSAPMIHAPPVSTAIAGTAPSVRVKAEPPMPPSLDVDGVEEEKALLSEPSKPIMDRAVVDIETARGGPERDEEDPKSEAAGSILNVGAGGADRGGYEVVKACPDGAKADSDDADSGPVAQSKLSATSAAVESTSPVRSIPKVCADDAEATCADGDAAAASGVVAESGVSDGDAAAAASGVVAESGVSDGDAAAADSGVVAESGVSDGDATAAASGVVAESGVSPRAEHANFDANVDVSETEQ